MKAGRMGEAWQMARVAQVVGRSRDSWVTFFRSSCVSVLDIHAEQQWSAVPVSDMMWCPV